MSTVTATGHRSHLENYRQLKAKALMLALAGQCRTPLDAVRFVFAQLRTTDAQVAEAAEARPLTRV